MYTHELADALKKLAAILKRGPDVELEHISHQLNLWVHGVVPSPEPRRPDDLPLALSALLSLSRVDKSEWIALIKDLGLPIEVRPRDASRDILGKVLRVLESDTNARERLDRRVKSREKHASPELARALSFLLSR